MPWLRRLSLWLSPSAPPLGTNVAETEPDPDAAPPWSGSRRTLLQFAAIAACAPAIGAVQPPAPAVAAVTSSRNRLVTGAYLPSAKTTGVTPGTKLTNVTSVVKLSGTKPQTIRGKRFLNYVYLTGSNKVFKDCEFVGPLKSTHETVTAVYSGSKKNKFIDCTFKARAHNDRAGNLIGRGVHLLRCNISHGVDGLGAAPAVGGTRVDMIVEACWIHDLAYFRPSKTHSDGQTHSDGIQWHGGAGLTVIGSRIEAFAAQTFGTTSGVVGGLPSTRRGLRVALSALMINQKGALRPSELRFENNWVDGGAVAINMLGCPTAFPAGNKSRIVNNRFGVRIGYSQNHVIVGRARQSYKFSGNARWVKSDPMNRKAVCNRRVNA